MSLYLVLRFIHVTAGVVWAGAAFMIAWKIIPSANDAGPAGGQFMQALMRRKLVPSMMALAVLTLVSGGWLFWLAGSGDFAAYLGTGMGKAYAFGGALGLLAFGTALSINLPVSKRVAAIAAAIAAAGGPPTPDQQEQLQWLRGRLALGSKIIGHSLLLSAALMGIARAL